MTHASTARTKAAGRPFQTLSLAGLLLVLPIAAAEARDFMLYNESGDWVDKIYARPVDPALADTMYADHRVEGGDLAPGGIAQLRVDAEYCQYDLLVTFQGELVAIEAPAVDLCWHPHVIVGPDYISLM